MHNRMPVILDGPDDPVSPRVNNARNEGLELTEPLRG